MQSLSKDELRALLTAAKASKERDWLMILVAYWHGLRASEVVNLKASSIRDGHITVQRLKGSNRTTQPLMSHADPLLDLKNAILIYVEGMHPEQKVFSVTRKAFWQMFQRYGASAGLPAHKRHPHCAKHSIAMHYIADAGIENMRQWLGHKNISSTGEYLKTNDELASAVMIKAAQS